jgi:hypothetical protein
VASTYHYPNHSKRGFIVLASPQAQGSHGSCDRRLCPDTWPRDLWPFAVLIIGLIPLRSNKSEVVSVAYESLPSVTAFKQDGWNTTVAETETRKTFIQSGFFQEVEKRQLEGSVEEYSGRGKN